MNGDGLINMAETAYYFNKTLGDLQEDGGYYAMDVNGDGFIQMNELDSSL